MLHMCHSVPRIEWYSISQYLEGCWTPYLPSRALEIADCSMFSADINGYASVVYVPITDDILTLVPEDHVFFQSLADTQTGSGKILHFLRYNWSIQTSRSNFIRKSHQWYELWLPECPAPTTLMDLSVFFQQWLSGLMDTRTLTRLSLWVKLYLLSPFFSWLSLIYPMVDGYPHKRHVSILLYRPIRRRPPEVYVEYASLFPRRFLFLNIFLARCRFFISIDISLHTLVNRINRFRYCKEPLLTRTIYQQDERPRQR